MNGSFRGPFASTEFRALWAAEALSQVGDQLARVALAVLVYDPDEIGPEGLAAAWVTELAAHPPPPSDW